MDDRRALRRNGRVHVPAAELAGVYVEAEEGVKAEPHFIVRSAPGVDGTERLHQLLAGRRLQGDQVDGGIMLVRAFRRSAGTDIERRIAIDRDRLDRANGGNDEVADVTEGLDDVRPLAGRRNLER